MPDANFPYVLVEITDDNGNVRNNSDGSFPFPLDIKSFNIKQSISEASQRFTITLDSPLTSGTGSYPIGKYETYFTNLNNDVTIRIGSGSPGTVVIVGNIMGWQKTYKEPSLPVIDFKGKDRTENLMNIYINNIRRITSGTDYGQAIRDLFVDVDTGGVKTTSDSVPLTGSKLDSDIIFYRKPVYDIIKTLADAIKYDFWVDTSNSLNFKKRGSTTNSTILDSSRNAVEVQANKDVDETINTVWVYAGRVLAEPVSVSNEPVTFKTGSLTYPLSNLFISGLTAVSGTVASSNFVFRTGSDYTLSSNSSLVFTSAGSKPDNNTTVNISYVYFNRGRSVYAAYKDKASASQFKTEKATWVYRPEIASNATGTSIQDKYTNAFLEARKLAEAEYKARKSPKERVLWRASEWVGVSLGDQMTVNIPEFNLRNQQFRVTDVDINYTREKPINIDLVLTRLEGEEWQ